MRRMPNPIDLTNDHSDDEAERARRRKRKRAKGDSDVVIVRDTADCDAARGKRKRLCPPRAGLGQAGTSAGVGRGEDDDADVVVVADVGQVATRDLAHGRPDCSVHPFKFGVFGTNGTHCKQCYCYVCDVKASDCQFWGTGNCAEDHANARPISNWSKLRTAAREGNKALVRETFTASKLAEAAAFTVSQLLHPKSQPLLATKAKAPLAPKAPPAACKISAKVATGLQPAKAPSPALPLSAKARQSSSSKWRESAGSNF